MLAWALTPRAGLGGGGSLRECGDDPAQFAGVWQASTTTHRGSCCSARHFYPVGTGISSGTTLVWLKLPVGTGVLLDAVIGQAFERAGRYLNGPNQPATHTPRNAVQRAFPVGVLDAGTPLGEFQLRLWLIELGSRKAVVADTFWGNMGTF